MFRIGAGAFWIIALIGWGCACVYFFSPTHERHSAEEEVKRVDGSSTVFEEVLQ